MALVGGLTALFAATIAVGQFDIKKVLAYSTISQLGFMVAAVGMGAFTAGMFHLVTHAFFKALLFLSAGSVIQGVEAGQHAYEHMIASSEPTNRQAHRTDHSAWHFDPQDMRNMGGLYQRMPVTFGVYLIGALALAGIVPLAGFWSKDEILAEAQHLQPGIYGLLTIAAFLTAFYMGRQVWMVFFGQPRSRTGRTRPRKSAAADRPADPAGRAFGAGRRAQPAWLWTPSPPGWGTPSEKPRQPVRSTSWSQDLNRTGAGGDRAGLLPLWA